MQKLIVSALVACLPVTAFASGSLSSSDILKVKPISTTNFEVIEGAYAGPRAYWCAAGLYVEETLGIQQTRIYIAAGRGNSQTTPGRKAVQFTTTPIGNVGSSVTVSTRQVGANLSSGHAMRFCDDYVIRDDDF